MGETQLEIVRGLIESNPDYFEDLFDVHNIIFNYDVNEGIFEFIGNKKNVSQAFKKLFSTLNYILEHSLYFDLSPYMIPDNNLSTYIREFKIDKGIILMIVKDDVNNITNSIKVIDVSQENKRYEK